MDTEHKTENGKVMCVECEDTAAVVLCNECQDPYCALCYQWQHSKGKRAKHSTTKLPGAEDQALAGFTSHFSSVLEKKEASFSPSPSLQDTENGFGNSKCTIHQVPPQTSNVKIDNVLIEEIQKAKPDRQENQMNQTLEEKKKKGKEEEEAEDTDDADDAENDDEEDDEEDSDNEEDSEENESDEDSEDQSSEKDDDEEDGEGLSANNEGEDHFGITLKSRKKLKREKIRNKGERRKNKKKTKKVFKQNNHSFKNENLVSSPFDVSGDNLVTRCRYIPLRINEEERALLHLLEGALNVSEYTDNVDVANSNYGYRGFFFSSYSFTRQDHRPGLIRKELEEIFHLIFGLHLCKDFRIGSKLFEETQNADTFEKKVDFLRTVFEIGRRYKIMNPDKMRETYGKLMHILQDAQTPGVVAFSCVIPIKTVYSILKEKNSLKLLRDDFELVELASAEITPGADSTPDSIKTLLHKKSLAEAALISKYASENLSADDIRLILSSIADNNNFVASNRNPIEKMIKYLLLYFPPQNTNPADSLAITRLPHNHPTQFTYVLQSLLLWKEIIGNMFYLWLMTEADLLSTTNRYRLMDTGQGLHRVQAAPKVGQAMGSILACVKSQMKSHWVGLSVVHLGDRDVPNALVFIDKYNQVSRILNPIVRVIESLDGLSKQEGLSDMIETQYGGLEALKKSILRNYFRHGFDGSGSDGGSCIDGRLTSSWNWCSLIEKKDFYHIFLLSNFEGFDGDYKKE